MTCRVNPWRRAEQRRNFAGAFLLCGFLALPLAGFSQDDIVASGMTPEQELEVGYADALLEAGLPDYASIVLSKLDLPAEIMAIRKIRSLTARGAFDEAREIVKANPGSSQAAMTLKLTLADGLYGWGKYDEAQALYEEFFKAFPNGPEEAIRPFYMSSAYRYAQMMILTGNRKVAADAYRMALRGGPEKHVQRQLQSELAELLMLMARDAEGAERKTLMEEIQKIAEEILWVQDLWFGRAIVLLAHMRVLEGDIDGAMKLVKDYTPQLRAIDQALREQSTEFGEDLTRLSPMAQCRYLIGEILHDRAVEILAEGGDRNEALGLLIGRNNSDGAVQHFLNVFIRYPNTSWAPDAGNRFRQVESMLKTEFDREVKARVTDEQWKAVELAQFREARALFNQGRFADASDNYLQVLGLFPENETSIPALGELAASYIEQESYTLADAVARHLAERFNQHPDFSVEAGTQLVRIAAKFNEVKQPLRHQDTFDVFFQYFKKHPRTLLDLQRFASEAMTGGDVERAIKYYTQIIADFAGRPAYFDSLSRMAQIFEQREDQNNQARTLMRLIKELNDAGIKSHLLVNSTYRLADLMRKMGPKGVERAQVYFRAVREMLSGADAASYASNAAEVEANARLLQAAMFYSALTDAMRTEVPDRVRAGLEKRAQKKLTDQEILNNFYKAGAIRQLEQLVKQFPESPFAPASLSQIGTINTFLQRSEAAAEALQQLQRQYPESPEAKNAVYMIGRNLLEMGMREEAVQYFKQMFAGNTQYPAAQILTAGQELLAADEFAIALEAFERAIGTTEDPRILEPARVGKGQALVGLEQFDQAVAWFDKVIEDYPQSALTITISESASAANAAVASRIEDREARTVTFNKAVDLMRRALRFAQDAGTQAKLEVAVAGLIERRAEAEQRFGTEQRVKEVIAEAVGAYQTVMMFRDGSDPAVAPHMQLAYSRAVPMMEQMGRWQDVFDDASGYLEKFPNGKFANRMRQAITTARIQGNISE